MGMLFATLLTLVSNKVDENKIMAILFLIYIFTSELVYYNQVVTFEQQVTLKTLFDSLMILGVLSFTKKALIPFTIALSVVLPQAYYLIILYFPNLMVEWLPCWFWNEVDTLFIYGVFIILYEQGTDFDFNKMSFKDYMLNFSILFCLIGL